MTQNQRPPDPQFGVASVRDARRRLHDHDKNLDLWWNRSRHCWEVREFVMSSGNWSYCFLWRGEGGEYRDPLAGFGALLEKLAECDTTRFGDTPNAWRHWDNWMSQSRVESVAKKRAEKDYIEQTILPDYIKREGGRREGTVKAGDHRRDTSDVLRVAAAALREMG